jgi:hypothetical protein
MTETKVPSGIRQFGYLISIVINFIIMYAANNLTSWNTPYLTDRFSECLWAINLSLSAVIFAHLIFMVFDPKWFRSFMKSLTNVFSFISVYVFRQVFPLDLSDSMMRTANLGLVILLLLLLLSIFLELINSIKFYKN